MAIRDQKIRFEGWHIVGVFLIVPLVVAIFRIGVIDRLTERFIILFECEALFVKIKLLVDLPDTTD